MNRGIFMKRIHAFLVFLFFVLDVNANTLPEQLSPQIILNFVQEQNIDTVEKLIESLPQAYKKYVTLVFESEALHRDFVSGDYPRVVSWGADGRFILSWSTHPNTPSYQSVEFLQHDMDRWILGVIDFSEDRPSVKNPVECSTCHGDINKPLWGSFPDFSGTEHENMQLSLTVDYSNEQHVIDAVEQAMDSDDPRLSFLDLGGPSGKEFLEVNRHRRIFFPYSNEDDLSIDYKSISAVEEFNNVISWRHAEVLFNKIKAYPWFQV